MSLSPLTLKDCCQPQCSILLTTPTDCQRQCTMSLFLLTPKDCMLSATVYNVPFLFTVRTVVSHSVRCPSFCLHQRTACCQPQCTMLLFLFTPKDCRLPQCVTPYTKGLLSATMFDFAYCTKGLTATVYNVPISVYTKGLHDVSHSVRCPSFCLHQRTVVSHSVRCLFSVDTKGLHAVSHSVRCPFSVYTKGVHAVSHSVQCPSFCLHQKTACCQPQRTMSLFCLQ